jgi:hypothetical protein
MFSVVMENVVAPVDDPIRDVAKQGLYNLLVERVLRAVHIISFIDLINLLKTGPKGFFFHF